MAKNNKKMSQIQRLDFIRSELMQAEEVSVEKLATEFNVSEMTVRRDLEVLESRGEVIRTYGGAALAKRLTFEFAFRDKQNNNQQQKHRIAKKASEYVNDGDVVILDTGTTTLEIAGEIADRQNVTIITTSLAIVSALQFSSGIEVILLGGFLRGGSPDMHGPLTERNMEQFSADVSFMGADAIDDKGNTYTDDLRVVNLDQKMAAKAKKVIVTADSQKFFKSAMCKVFVPGDYDLIISDIGVDKKIAKKMTKLGIQMELV